MNDSNRSLLPALLAVGTSLTTLPASALELGEINVESTLGQPLRASISYALAPNEQLANYCVTLNPGNAGNGLPTITRADVSVANGIISLTGKTIVREPLMTVRVDVACPYTPNLSREYMLFINPSAPVKAAVPAAATAPAVAQADTVSRPSQPAIATRPTTRPATRRSVAASTPIDATARYRVQPGDSLSKIAERIENRPIGLWDAVAQIFDANPDAFIDNDPNKLKAGSWLSIPNFAESASAAPVFASSTDAEQPPATRSSTVGTATEAPSVAETMAGKGFAHDTSVLEPAATPPVDGLQPGDIVLDDENPYAAAGEPTVVIPDTEIEVTSSSTQSPNVPTARIVVPEKPAPSGTNWLLWLFGGGVALIIGLLLFGRRSRDLGDPAAVAAEPAHPMRRASDTGQTEALPDEDFIISDDSPTEENLALDADLEIGTGLQEGSDVDVRHDFAFASTTSLDLELPFEDDEDSSATDMMAAPTVEEVTILDKEVLPDDDDYDMSVIVDATKMPDTQEVTERDLKAVVVDEADDDEGGYTIDQEIDYQILEQDYEDELTATQALNKEIEKAAAELARRMDDPDVDLSDDQTEDMQLATVTDLDSMRPASESDDVDALDDTGVNEEMTTEMFAEEATVEMSADDNESTVEMPAKRGKTDTKTG